jgi:predicted DNA-binding transcriptional regulator YafY
MVSRDQGRDTLVRRLAMILVKLNEGESLEPQALATEFGVTLRTMQRDLNERFAYLPLERIQGRYRLRSSFLGKLTRQDVERFAALAGVQGLFLSFPESLRKVLDFRTPSAFLVRGHNYEDLSGKEAEFRLLEQAASSRHMVSFRYRGRDAEGSYANVEPYTLLNEKGIWYLVAKDNGKLKTFSFARINSVLVSDRTFAPDTGVSKTLARQDGIWFSENPVRVVLQVASTVAPYFKRRKVIANQVVEEELADGSLVVSAKVGHPNELLPYVRYWIPHVRIMRPPAMQSMLEDGLVMYLEAAYRKRRIRPRDWRR